MLPIQFRIDQDRRVARWFRAGRGTSVFAPFGGGRLVALHAAWPRVFAFVAEGAAGALPLGGSTEERIGRTAKPELRGRLGREALGTN